MKTDQQLKNILLAIAFLLFVIAARPYLGPERVEAQSSEGNDFHIEPGTFMLREPGAGRQVFGRVIVNLKTGDVWGFPTVTTDPYPTDATKPQPPTSEPFYLGKFDLAAARR